MTEQENLSVTQEVASPETQQSEPVQATQNDKEYNFKQLRDKADQQTREIEELRNFIQNQTKEAKPKEEEFSYSPDDLVTYGHLDKLAEKKAMEVVERTLKNRELADLPRRVKSQFSDFDLIVNNETVKEFEKNEPVLAAACASSPNPYEATYKMLKMLRKDTTDAKVTQNEERIDKNMKAPPAASSFGKGNGLQDANAFGALSQKEIYQEMMEFARRA